MGGTAKQEKEWAAFARQMGYYDFHRLDTCEYCGGVCDCWTKEYNGEERYRFRSEWICEKCEAVTDQLYDENMKEI